MHRAVGLIALPVAFLFVAAAGQSRQTGPGPRHVDSERVRLRAHFDSVLLELGSQDVSRLTSEQRAARTQLGEWLAEYRDAGVFPLNDLGTAEPVPIFRDSRGVLCAMAYLIDRSGHGDIVDAVANSRNTAHIAELVDDSRLVAWLDSTGLSAAEATRIQPSYGEPKGQGTRRLNTIILVGTSLRGLHGSTHARTRGGGMFAIVTGGLTVATTYGPAFKRYRGRHDLEIRRFIGGVAMFGGVLQLVAGPQSQSPDSSRVSASVHPSRDPATGRLTWTIGMQARF